MTVVNPVLVAAVVAADMEAKSCHVFRWQCGWDVLHARCCNVYSKTAEKDLYNNCSPSALTSWQTRKRKICLNNITAHSSDGLRQQISTPPPGSGYLLPATVFQLGGSLDFQNHVVSTVHCACHLCCSGWDYTQKCRRHRESLMCKTVVVCFITKYFKTTLSFRSCCNS